MLVPRRVVGMVPVVFQFPHLFRSSFFTFSFSNFSSCCSAGVRKLLLMLLVRAQVFICVISAHKLGSSLPLFGGRPCPPFRFCRRRRCCCMCYCMCCCGCMLLLLFLVVLRRVGDRSHHGAGLGRCHCMTMPLIIIVTVTTSGYLSISCGEDGG